MSELVSEFNQIAAVQTPVLSVVRIQAERGGTAVFEQAGCQPGSGHRMPLIPQAPGVQDKRVCWLGLLYGDMCCDGYGACTTSKVFPIFESSR